MSTKCLMLETADKRRLFTLIGNYKQLVEYCKAFNAKMFVVKAEVKKSQILSISSLVVALCDRGRESPEAEYEIIETKKV